MKKNIRTVTNIDGIVKTFTTDEEFINYARIIYKENEESEEDDPCYPLFHWLPENIQQATEYIHEWCDDLELNEMEQEFVNNNAKI
jgi:hypothetical protein